MKREKINKILAWNHKNRPVTSNIKTLGGIWEETIWGLWDFPEDTSPEKEEQLLWSEVGHIPSEAPDYPDVDKRKALRGLPAAIPIRKSQLIWFILKYLHVLWLRKTKATTFQSL